VQLFGNDYDTPDGTCIRDYVHVADLCDAHLLALEYLAGNSGCHVFNLGTGKGYSVAEVLAACRESCNGQPAAEYTARRPGDPSTLVAGASLARDLLDWQPMRSMAQIATSAIHWHSTHDGRQG
jgi:UDP-glucose 4-epimerase